MIERLNSVGLWVFGMLVMLGCLVITLPLMGLIDMWFAPIGGLIFAIGLVSYVLVARHRTKLQNRWYRNKDIINAMYKVEGLEHTAEFYGIPEWLVIKLAKKAELYKDAK